MHCSLFAGDDFKAEGFESMVHYLYSGSVNGVTAGLLNTDKAAAALQAADFFGVTALRRAVEQCAQRCGAIIETV
jgi:BTB/POZ domain